MKIIYNAKEQFIKIKDNLKSHYCVLKFLMILNLLNATLRLYNVHQTGLDVQKIFWLVLGLISAIVLYFLIVKKSTSEKIPIQEIVDLRKKSIFGRKSLSIELKNGKKRDLTELKSPTEIMEVQKMFSNFHTFNSESR